mgnify:CR=1 FL=1
MKILEYDVCYRYLFYILRNQAYCRFKNGCKKKVNMIILDSLIYGI